MGPLPRRRGGLSTLQTLFQPETTGSSGCWMSYSGDAALGYALQQREDVHQLVTCFSSAQPDIPRWCRGGVCVPKARLWSIRCTRTSMPACFGKKIDGERRRDGYGFPFILSYHDLACGWRQLPDPGNGPPPWPPKEAMAASNLEGCSDVDTVSELFLASHFEGSHGINRRDCVHGVATACASMKCSHFRVAFYHWRPR